MPMYDFQCQTHGDFEKIVPYDTERSNCPTCEELSPRILMGSKSKYHLKFLFNYMAPDA